MSKLREASRAVGRGSTGEALVLLWNELEPARLAGDEGALQGIESLATAIAVRGDDADRREAERLLEAIERYRGTGGVPATAHVEGEVVTGDDGGYGDSLPTGARYETIDSAPDEAPEQAQGGRGLGGLLWLVLLAGIVLFNLLGDLLGR